MSMDNDLPEAIATAFFSCRSNKNGELAFNEGDKIKVIQFHFDWWYGELLSSQQQGWFSPFYGHVFVMGQLEMMVYSHSTTHPVLKPRLILYDGYIKKLMYSDLGGGVSEGSVILDESTVLESFNPLQAEGLSYAFQLTGNRNGSQDETSK